VKDRIRQLAAFEPALVRGIIGLAVAGLLIWGLDYTELGGKLQATADVLGGIVALVSQWWVRAGVTPAAAVIARVTNPLDAPAEARYRAGGYNVHKPGRALLVDSSLADLTGHDADVELFRDF
jgi:hypothetical protein